MRVDDFAAFIRAREQVRVNKERGRPKPWTDDPILQTYRFCNARREDDRVTRWIAENWRQPGEHDPHIWFAMVVARLFNLPSTLAIIDYPVPWKATTRSKLKRIAAMGGNVFNAAYIVSTNGRPMNKIDYVIDVVLAPMWKARGVIPKPGTLAALHAVLMEFQGMGSFMAAQVVADVKYTPAYRGAEDWATWAASGPGSRRGLNRVMDLPTHAPWREDRWLRGLTALRKATLPLLPKPLRDLHAQDIQNCLCEFDKYERIRTGEGRPKQLYPGLT